MRIVATVGRSPPVPSSIVGHPRGNLGDLWLLNVDVLRANPLTSSRSRRGSSSSPPGPQASLSDRLGARCYSLGNSSPDRWCSRSGRRRGSSGCPHPSRVVPGQLDVNRRVGLGLDRQGRQSDHMPLVATRGLVVDLQVRPRVLVPATKSVSIEFGSRRRTPLPSGTLAP